MEMGGGLGCGRHVSSTLFGSGGEDRGNRAGGGGGFEFGTLDSVSLGGIAGDAVGEVIVSRACALASLIFSRSSGSGGSGGNGGGGGGNGGGGDANGWGGCGNGGSGGGSSCGCGNGGGGNVGSINKRFGGLFPCSEFSRASSSIDFKIIFAVIDCSKSGNKLLCLIAALVNFLIKHYKL